MAPLEAHRMPITIRLVYIFKKMVHPSETSTADVNEFGTVRIPEEILRKLGAGIGDLISFVKDGESIRLVVRRQNSIKEDQVKNSTGLTNSFRLPTMLLTIE